MSLSLFDASSPFHFTRFTHSRAILFYFRIFVHHIYLDLKKNTLFALKTLL